MTAVASEVGDSVAELFIAGQRNAAKRCFPYCLVEGAAPGRQASDSGVGNRARQSPVSASSRAALTRPALGTPVILHGFLTMGDFQMGKSDLVRVIT